MSLIKSVTLKKMIKEAVIKHLLREVKKEDKGEECKDCDKSEKVVSKSSKGGKTIGKKPYHGQKVDPMSLHTISGTSSAKSKSSKAKVGVAAKKVDKSGVKSDDEPKEMKRFGGHYDDKAYELNETDEEIDDFDDKIDDFDDEIEDSEY